MTNKGKILLTGGTGYIGSHTCVELLEQGAEVAIVDNLSNSSARVLDRLEKITGKRVAFYEADIRDRQAMIRVLNSENPAAVVHFAGLKAVGESVAQPLDYYDNNVTGTQSLLFAMQETGVRQLVFSSSATVYGDPETVPIDESEPLGATNPYGRTKLMIEEILRDMVAADATWKISILRYFNPVGAHVSGLIGEDPRGVPNNLMPYVAQVAVGKLERLQIYGDDYPTKDGTGVRDYIHVVDLARGHLAALEALRDWSHAGPLTVNLGTGTGYSVLEMVAAFQRASGKEIAYDLVERRPGDVAQCFSNPALASELLGWRAGFGVERMCEDTWRWQTANPEGYD